MTTTHLARTKSFLSHCMVHLITWPYSFTLEGFTVGPLNRIAQQVGDREALRYEVIAFLRGKSQELRLAYVGATLAAAATIGVFSWNSIGTTTWLAHACFFTSLDLAIFAIVAANQLSALVHDLTSCQPRDDKPADPDCVRRFLALIGLRRHCSVEDVEQQKSEPPRLSKTMLYIWQAPLMLMGWSWNAFLVGFMLHATAPLRHDRDVGNNVRAAIFVLIVHLVLSVNFCGTVLILKLARQAATADR